jgi:DNA-binding NtrC family response regulator
MKHILTIDDETQIREILRQVLVTAGYRVTDVASADEALQVVQADPPDLIITDLQLEESDGFDVIAQMKQLRPQTPIILLTGVLFDPSVVKRLGEDKIAAYIEKTSSLERILGEVRKHAGAPR